MKIEKGQLKISLKTCCRFEPLISVSFGRYIDTKFYLTKWLSYYMTSHIDHSGIFLAPTPNESGALTVTNDHNDELCEFSSQNHCHFPFFPIKSDEPLISNVKASPLLCKVGPNSPLTPTLELGRLPRGWHVKV